MKRKQRSIKIWFGQTVEFKATLNESKRTANQLINKNNKKLVLLTNPVVWKYGEPHTAQLLDHLWINYNYNNVIEEVENKIKGEEKAIVHSIGQVDQYKRKNNTTDYSITLTPIIDINHDYIEKLQNQIKYEPKQRKTAINQYINTLHTIQNIVLQKKYILGEVCQTTFLKDIENKIQLLEIYKQQLTIKKKRRKPNKFQKECKKLKQESCLRKNR